MYYTPHLHRIHENGVNSQLLFENHLTKDKQKIKLNN